MNKATSNRNFDLTDGDFTITDEHPSRVCVGADGRRLPWIAHVDLHDGDW